MEPLKIFKCLETILNDYKEPITKLSKTNKNYYIKNDFHMFDWDNISKTMNNHGNADNSPASVDAVYYSSNTNEPVLYFFEFKKMDLYDERFDARKELTKLLGEMETCLLVYDYSKRITDLKKKLISKKVISLKTKPLESLILLHNILHEEGISHEDIISIRKEYYVVSETPIKNFNRSNFHRKGRSSELFGFIDKIKPFPFIKIELINEKTFLKIVNDLKKDNN